MIPRPDASLKRAALRLLFPSRTFCLTVCAKAQGRQVHSQVQEAVGVAGTTAGVMGAVAGTGAAQVC